MVVQKNKHKPHTYTPYRGLNHTRYMSAPPYHKCWNHCLPKNMVLEEHCDQCSASNDVVLQCNSCFINTVITRRQKRIDTNTVALAAAVALIAGQMAALS